MKKFFIFVLALVMNLSIATAVIVAADSNQTDGNWVGCFDNFGVETTDEGLIIVYDGYYSAELDDDYIALIINIKTLKESIYEGSTIKQEGLMNFALLNTPCVNPTWSNDYSGLYMHVRNIGGKLYFKLFIKSTAVAAGYQLLYEHTTELNIGDVESIVLQKEKNGYSFFVNEVEYAHESLAGVPHGAMCDANGKTYFAYASFNNPDDADRKFLLKGVVNEKPEVSEPQKTCDCCDETCAGECICVSGSACNTACDCGCENCNSGIAENPEDTYAKYVTSETWGGPYGQFGVTPQWNGLNIIYDGWYTKALSPDYIEVNFSFINLLESIVNGTTYSQEGIFDIAFLDKQYTTPNWTRTSANGLYLMMRNIDDQVFVEVSYKSADMDAVQIIFNSALNIEIDAALKLVMEKGESGFILSINGIRLAEETTATLSTDIFCDNNGYTFFAMQSFATGGSGNDADKRLMSLSYIAEKKGQIVDPSILPPEQIEQGEEDYNAPVGLGLTAKKYGGEGTVTQLENGVRITGDSVLFTSLSNQSIETMLLIDVLPENAQLRLSLDSEQKIYSLNEVPAAFIIIKNENGIMVSADGTTWKDINVLLTDAVTIAFVISDGTISIFVNEEKIETQIPQTAITGENGTFLAFAMTEGVSIDVTSIKNKILNVDISSSANWNDPFGGVVQEENTIVNAHATLKTALDNDFVKIDFKINGLIDSMQCTSYITFALLMKNSICDPISPIEPGLYIWLRNYGGKLQFKISAQTEFMGIIESHDWTDLNIPLTERISLIFLKDNEKGSYRIFFNNFEVVGGKLDEILTLDSSDRNERTWFGIGCWNDINATDAPISETRSVIIYSVDNVFDKEDMPKDVIEIGEIKEVPGFDSEEEKPNGDKENENDKTGCSASCFYANAIGAVLLFAVAIAVMKKKWTD